MTKKQLTAQEINEIIAEFEFGEQEIFIDDKAVYSGFRYDDDIGDKYPSSNKKLYTESFNSCCDAFGKVVDLAGKKGKHDITLNLSRSLVLGYLTDRAGLFAEAIALSIQELGGGE